MSFPCGSAGKESTCSAGDLGSIPGLGRSPGEGKGYPLQYSGLENSMDYRVHGVAKSWTRLSDFHFTSLPALFSFFCLSFLFFFFYHASQFPDRVCNSQCIGFNPAHGSESLES